MRAGHVTEEGDLVPDALIQLMLAAADDYVGLNTHSLQLLDRGLRRFCLELAGRFNIRNECHMDEHGVLAAHLMLELADCF